MSRSRLFDSDFFENQGGGVLNRTKQRIHIDVKNNKEGCLCAKLICLGWILSH